MKKLYNKHFKKAFFITIILSFVIIINKVIFILSTLNKKVYEENSYYYQWKFGKINYIKKGSGKPILCIHSLKNGASSFEYHKIIKTLSNNYTVYAIDLLGYGKSEKPKLTFTSYMYLQLINDFLDDVIREEADIITSGKSNSFITMLSLQNPKYINKLIFINPADLTSLTKSPTNRSIALKYLLESPILGTLIYNILNSKACIKNQLNKSYYSKLNVNKKTINSFHENSHLGNGNNKYIYSSNICHYLNVNIKPALEEINNSIYIIQGNDFNDSNKDIINDYKKINASIEASIINKSKDFPHLEKPKSVLEVLSVYLS